MRVCPLVILCLLILSNTLFSCKKSEGLGTAPLPSLSYGDSVFYLKDQSADYIVYPTVSKTGIYTSFPDGLELDKNTGAINISKSESGLRYRITFRSGNGDTSFAGVVISGIDYPDKYYYLSQADTLALPVYNADLHKSIPPGIFDEGKLASTSGCSIATDNGRINIIQSIRNGLFGSVPKNNTRKDIEVKYRLEDKSGKALNDIKVLLYYYDTKNDVSADLLQTVQDHQAILQASTTGVLSSISSLNTRPRPPCIVIIGH